MRNSAIRAAEGQYIASLDSDDLWHPEELIDRKWSQAEQAELWCKPAEFSTSSFGQRLTRHVVKPVKKLVQELDRAMAWRRIWISPDRVVGQCRRQFEQAATRLPSEVSS